MRYSRPNLKREVMDLKQRVLRTDVSGMPLEWVGYQQAVRLITLGQVSYSLGKTLYHIHGGINAISHSAHRFNRHYAWQR